MGQSPFANFVTSALGTYQAVRKMKTDETAANAASKKADNESRSLGVKEKEATTKSNEAETKGLLEFNTALTQQVKQLQDQVLRDNDLSANDPKKLKPQQLQALQGQIAEAQKNSQWALTQIQRRLSQQTPTTAAPERGADGFLTRTPPPPRGIAAPGRSNLTTPNANFNQAPAQNTGGRGEVGPQGESGPEGLEYPESPASEPPLPTSAGSTNTPTQAPQAPVQFISGDWPGAKVLPSKSIFNVSTGKQWAGNIAVNSSGDTFITANPDLTDANQITDPAVLKSNVEEVRKAHLIKFILDSRLEKSVRPDASELIGSESYRTNENTPIWSRMEKAHALASRILSNTAGEYDPDETRLSVAFQQKFGFSPSDYMVWGNRGAGDLAKQNSLATSKLNAEAAALTGQVNQLLTQVAKDQTADYKLDFDPGAGERKIIQDRLNNLTTRIQAAGGDPEMSRQLGAEIQSYEARLKTLEADRAARVDRAKAGRENRELNLRIAQMAMEQAGQIKSGVGLTGLLQREETVGKAMAGYVGAVPGDVNQYAGFVSAGLRKIPYVQGGEAVRFREIQGPNNTLVPDRMDVPEFVSWSAVNRPDLLVRYAALQPNEKNREAASDLTKKFYGTAVPTNKIFDALLRNPGWFDKQFDPQVGAAATVDRNALIANFRQALIGPGNPSNFEQEIMRDVIPDPSQIFSINAKSKEKVRAIAMMSVMNHYHSMVQNGFEMTEDTLAIYNNSLSRVIGRELTMEDFGRINEYWSTVRSGYAANGYIPGRGNVLTPEGSNQVFNAFQGFVDEVISRPNKTTPKK